MATPVKVAAFFVAATIGVPTFIFWSPAISLLAQFLEGCWLAAGTWSLINSSQQNIEALQESLGNSLSLGRGKSGGNSGSGGGPLEFVVSLPAYPLVWTELFLRRQGLSPRLRYCALNCIAYTSAPVWFLLITCMHLLVLVALSAISLGVLLPWTGPVMLAVSGYLLLVPVWIFSTYVCSFLPIVTATALLPEFDNLGEQSSQLLTNVGFAMPFVIEAETSRRS